MIRYDIITVQLEYNHLKMGDYRELGQAQLRKVLDIMFPSSYIQLYHRPPSSICTLLDLSPICPRNRLFRDSSDQTNLHEVSTEPSSRESIIALREHLDSSLRDHQAKPSGLCPIRRAIYNQCFDELIRQVTVGCIEQGLLLYRIRNELHMTLNSYRKAYESGVCFGLEKAVEAEVQLEEAMNQMKRLETDKSQLETKLVHERQVDRLDMENKLDSFEKLKKHFADELKKKDQVIEQQRSMIRALSQKLTNDMRSPI